MNRKLVRLAAGAGLAGLLAMALGMPGFATNEDRGFEAALSSPSYAPSGAPTDGERTSDPFAEEDLLSRNERLMVLMFRAMLEMELQPDTKFERRQAEVLLPVIRDIVEEGGLTADKEKQVTGVFTQVQAELYVRFSRRLVKPPDNDAPDPGAAPESRHPADTDRPDGMWLPNRHPKTDDSDTRNWGDNDKSVEQQVIDMLESKLKTS